MKKKISRCNRRYEQVVLFFRMEFSKQKFVFDFLKAIFDTNSKPSRPFFFDGTDLQRKWSTTILGQNLPVLNFAYHVSWGYSLIQAI